MTESEVPAKVAPAEVPVVDGSQPTTGPLTFQVPFQRRWEILRPRVYRWLEKKYVDAFFEDGTLRLSSFSQFSKHGDELRKDSEEGSGVREATGHGLTVIMSSARGRDCYVLCGSTMHTNEIAQSLNQYDACFVIDDTVQFAMAVALKLPFVGGVEGAVIYKDSTVISRSFGGMNYDELVAPYRLSDGTFDMKMIADLGNRLGGVEELFIKNSRFANQFEYRFLWCTGSTVPDHIDVKVPEARQFCRRAVM